MYLVKRARVVDSAHECIIEAMTRARTLALGGKTWKVIDHLGIVMAVVGGGFAIKAALHQAQRANNIILDKKASE